MRHLAAHGTAWTGSRASTHRSVRASLTSGDPLTDPAESSSELTLTAQERGAHLLVEIHLEEMGQHSWLKAVVNTLTGSYGSAQLRFVARLVGLPDVPTSHVATGATFPVMRFADLNDEIEPNTWSGLAHQRLGELDAELLREGWHRRPDQGPHWWSLKYDKPFSVTDPGYEQ